MYCDICEIGHVKPTFNALHTVLRTSLDWSPTIACGPGRFAIERRYCPRQQIRVPLVAEAVLCGNGVGYLWVFLTNHLTAGVSAGLQ